MYVTELKSNMQEIFLLGLLRMCGVHSEISTSIFYPHFLKSLSVLLGSFHRVERILSYSLSKPGRSISPPPPQALNAAPKPSNNYLVNWETLDFVNWA